MPASLLRLGGWRSVGALVVVAAAATGIGQTGAGHALLEKAGLIQRPGHTALYFGKPTRTQLVLTKPAGKSVSYTLTFFVRNAEPRPHEYRWSMFLVRPGRRAPLKPLPRPGLSCPGPRPRFRKTERSPAERDVWNLLSSWRTGARPSTPGPPAAGARAEWVAQRPVVAVVCDVIYPYSRGGRNCGTRNCCPGWPGWPTCTSTPCGGGAVRRSATRAGSATTPSRGCTRCTGTAAGRSGRRFGSRWPACACWAAGSTCWRPTRSRTSSCSYSGWWPRSSGSRSP